MISIEKPKVAQIFLLKLAESSNLTVCLMLPLQVMYWRLYLKFDVSETMCNHAVNQCMLFISNPPKKMVTSMLNVLGDLLEIYNVQEIGNQKKIQ